MGRLSQLGLCSTDGTLGIDEVSRVKRCTARLTLISIGTGLVAMGASSHDIAVGQELFGLGIVVLFALLFDEFAVVVQLAEEVGSQPAVHL